MYKLYGRHTVIILFSAQGAYYFLGAQERTLIGDRALIRYGARIFFLNEGEIFRVNEGIVPSHDNICRDT